MDKFDTKQGLDFLNKIISFRIKNRMSNDHVFYETKESIEEKFGWLQTLGSSGVTSAQYGEPENSVEATCIYYGGFQFHIVNVENL